MTPVKALAALAKIKERAAADAEAVLSQLTDDDRARVEKFLEA